MIQHLIHYTLKSLLDLGDDYSAYKIIYRQIQNDEKIAPRKGENLRKSPLRTQNLLKLEQIRLNDWHEGSFTSQKTTHFHFELDALT